MTEAAKVKEGMMPVAQALNTVIELHNKCLRRGLFRDIGENVAHIEALGMLEEYIKETITDRGPDVLVPEPMAKEVNLGGEG